MHSLNNYKIFSIKYGKEQHWNYPKITRLTGINLDTSIAELREQLRQLFFMRFSGQDFDRRRLHKCVTGFIQDLGNIRVSRIRERISSRTQFQKQMSFKNEWFRTGARKVTQFSTATYVHEFTCTSRTTKQLFLTRVHAICIL